jgi:hypothetical protein
MDMLVASLEEKKSQSGEERSKKSSVMTCCYAASDTIVFSNFVVFCTDNIVGGQRYSHM